MLFLSWARQPEIKRSKNGGFRELFNAIYCSYLVKQFSHITKKVHGADIDFNVDTTPADNAVHVHVSVSSNSLEEFNKFTDQSEILE